MNILKFYNLEAQFDYKFMNLEIESAQAIAYGCRWTLTGMSLSLHFQSISSSVRELQISYGNDSTCILIIYYFLIVLLIILEYENIVLRIYSET